MAFIMFSCVNSNVESLKYESYSEAINLKNFLVDKKRQYKALGSYFLKDTAVITDFIVDNDQYSILILDMGNYDKKLKIDINKESDYKDMTSSYSIVNQNYFEFNYYLRGNDADIKFTKQIEQISLNVEGIAKEVIVNDSISSYYVNFSNFEIVSEKGVLYSGIAKSAVKETEACEIMFYKRKNKLYMFLMTLNDTDNYISAGTLRNYIFQ